MNHLPKSFTGHSIGYSDQLLSSREISHLTQIALARQSFEGQRVLVVIPDGTRSAPLPQMFRLLHKELGCRVAALDFLIALGTHQPLSESQINELVGVSSDEWQTDFSGVNVYNHDWSDSEAFVSLGTIPSKEVEEISEGMLAEEVEVRVNRKVVEYDQVIICGPVFPHEVVGFSGGNKYFFPGVSGPEIIDLSHWLGALITNYEIIGTKGLTPVRRLIDRAASMIQRPKLCFAMVVEPGGEDLMGLYIDSPEKAWEAAAELSSRVHVNYVDKPLRRVLSVMPESYDDMWTAAKGMYKMEPAVEDGGGVIIFAPHITEFSRTHGEQLAEVGYHVRDYFLKRWDEFKDYPGTVLAHSTHLKGTGSYDEETGRETPRVNVTLATGISEERCRQHNLGYLDPDQVDLRDWPEKPEKGSLMVPKAGEILYKLSFGREQHH